MGSGSFNQIKRKKERKMESKKAKERLNCVISYYTTKTLLTPWFEKWGPMQQIKKKMIKTNQESKHSKAKTTISL